MMGTFSRRNSKSAKLTLEQVRLVRDEYEAGMTQGELSRKFGLSVGQIGRIVRGESWQQLGGPIDGMKKRLSLEESLEWIKGRVATGDIPTMVEEESRESETSEEKNTPEDWRAGLTTDQIEQIEKGVAFGADPWALRKAKGWIEEEIE